MQLCSHNTKIEGIIVKNYFAFVFIQEIFFVIMNYRTPDFYMTFVYVYVHEASF